jgi:hypothetical protein
VDPVRIAHYRCARFVESDLVKVSVTSEHEAGALGDFSTEEEADLTTNLDPSRVYEKD